MKLTDRKLVRQTSAIGLVITLVVIAAGFFGLLNPLERWLYDHRARLFQFFTPPATDKLVHLDIDDPTLEAVGHLPWPRHKVALIIDEVHRAGAAVIALDIVFPDPEPVLHEPLIDAEYADRSPGIVEGPFRRVHGDGDLVDAVSRAGNVLLPVYFRIDVPPTPRGAAVLEELTADLELTRDELGERLRQRGFAVPETQLGDLYIRGLQEAVFQRVMRALDEGNPSLDELRKRLLPKTDSELGGSIQIRQLVAQFDKAQSIRSVRRLALPKPPGLDPAMPVQADLPPIPALSRAAGLSGSLYYRADEDGVVRSMPLWLEQQGWIHPQVGLVMACQMLGIKISDIQFQSDRIVLRPPPEGQPEIAIPIRHEWISELKRDVGLYFDIPWFGPTEQWQTMYDPQRRATAQHRPVNEVWQIIRTGEKIIQNNSNIDRALSVILGDDQSYKLALDPAKAREFAQHRPAPTDTAARLTWIDQTLHDLKESGWLETFQNTQKNDMTASERRQFEELTSAAKVLREAPSLNAALQKQLDQQRKTLREALEGKAVLVGWTATGVAADFVPTSLHSKCPGPVVHGVIFNAIMTRHFLWPAPAWVTPVVTALLGVLMVSVMATLRSPVASIAAAVVLALGYFLVNGLLLYDYGGWVVGAAEPLVTVAAVWSSATVWHFGTEIRERRRVTARFRSYVDPALVNYVVEHPDEARLEGQVRELTVVFTDLAGFTALSERLREKTVAILNEYLATVVPVIKAHHGFVNKFLGDGIMFFYGAPEANEDHAASAVTTVLRIRESLATLNHSLESRGLPALVMRAGICSGPMIVGDAGGSDRSDYTVLGDEVNLASRLESANKATGSRILINARTAELIGDRFLVRPIARLRVVGKTEGVMTFEPLAPAAEATEDQRRLAAATKAMVDAFFAREFQTCLDAAERLEKAHGPDALAKLYLNLSQQYLREPPGPDFDGQIVVAEK